MESQTRSTYRRAPQAVDFLAGGGAMGALIRTFDWSATEFGAPDTWPSPLQTALGILLSTNHPVFIFWGAELRCFYNDAYSRSLGNEKHHAMLGSAAEQSWEEIWDIIGPQIRQVMAGLGATWHENHLVPITRHGRLESVYWTYGFSPIRDPDAPTGVGGVLVLCTETTEQVLGAERLKEAEARWKSLFHQAPGFMCILRGPHHVFEFANPSYFELVARRDIIGQPIDAALPWAGEQGFIALLDRVYASGEPYTAIEAAMFIGGPGGAPAPPTYVDFVYQPIRDDRGAVNGIFVLGSDVTARRRATLALEETAQRLRIACDAAALGIHDFNVITGRVQWDARVRQLWGVGPDEPVDYEVFAAGLHPEDRAPTRQAVDRALDPAGDGRFFCEYRVNHRTDGVTRWVQANGQAFFVEGRAVRLVGTVQDVTEREQADSRRNEFLATLSHELRNPLAPIANALQILKSRDSVDGVARDAQAVIGRQLAQIVRLIDDLLDVVRVTRDRIELRKEDILMGDVIQLALETALPHIDRGHHDVAVHMPTEAIHVRGDLIRLAQVFSNLLINACKYSDDHSRITLTVDPPDKAEVRVSVRDPGIGIEPQNLLGVFEMFSQSQHSLDRAQGGLGIGLSLAKGLVELHGGRIAARSDGLGQGSEFVVHIPTIEAPRLAGDSASTSSNPPGAIAGRRVLVVDDQRDGADTLAELLGLEGAVVWIASDGGEAISAFDEFKPDIVLLDIGLPLMNGYEVCRTMRARPSAADVRIIALTGWGQEGDRLQSRAAGFDAHLVKPIDFDQLLQLLAEPCP